MPSEKFKRLHLCIRKHYAIINELSDRKKPSEQEEILYCIMSSIPPAQNNEKLSIHRHIKLRKKMKKICIYIEGALYLHHVDHMSIYNSEFVLEMWNGQ